MTRKLGILAGAFNPPTRAHFALCDAASTVVDEVICVVPRTYPHKYFHGADLHGRVEMLQQAGGACVVTEGGLFIEIARELRHTRPDAEIFFICGRDAAERIVNWDYDEPGTANRMFDEFGMLVAQRQGLYVPPDHLRDRILPLNMPGSFDDVSSTEVRRRIAAREPWEHLVPESIVDLVRRIYGPASRALGQHH